ncbi:hypothetical protein HDV00_003681 [Rhizophlyctis rosea]|nr:hypothetical protein HDV00_003681 [Rhizophlyctis rosea]
MDAAVEFLVSSPSFGQPPALPSRAAAQPPPQPQRAASLQQQQSLIETTQDNQDGWVLQSAIDGLRNLGFTNDDDNRQALRAANGRVDAAVNLLLDRQRSGAGQRPQQPVQAQVANAQQQQPQQRTGTPIPTGPFAIEGPPQQGRGGQRGTRAPSGRPAGQQSQPGADLFGEGGAFGGGSSAASAQGEAQGQAGGDLFGMNEPAAAPTDQPGKSNAKDSIMSLFNTPPPQQQTMMMGGNNPFAMPQQGGYMMGQGQMYGMNPQMGMIGGPQMGMMNMPQQQQGMMRQGFGGPMPGQMMPGQMMQGGQGMMGMQGGQGMMMGMGMQQGGGQNYATYSPARQAGPFGSGFGTPPVAFTPPQSNTPRMGTPNPFGPSTSQTSVFGSQQQQPQQQEQTPSKPDLFADLGPSFGSGGQKQPVSGGNKPNPFM